MKVFAPNVRRFLLVLCLCVASLALAMAPPSFLAADIAGKYTLMNAKTGTPDSVDDVIITPWPQEGSRAFLVRGSGGWVGKGELTDAASGYYDWRFDDGKAGRTTFVIDTQSSSFCIVGTVISPDPRFQNWKYRGCK